jgi:hypothetical protein
MLRNKNNGTSFYCFSPPVMFATFAIEIALLLYTLFRYKLTPLSRLIVSALFFLGSFQLAEYFVCTGSQSHAELIARIGNICITMLPPIGLHMIYVIAKKPERSMVKLAYATAALFISFFAFYPIAYNYYGCGGNYAMFNLVEPVNYLYGVYYYGWLFYGIYLSIIFSKAASIAQRKALTYQAYGYISFILPTGIVNLINPTTIAGIPSIMCGFAVIYALAIALGIGPLLLESKKAKSS